MRFIAVLLMLLTFSSKAETLHLVKAGKPSSAIIITESAGDPYIFPSSPTDAYTVEKALNEFVEYVEEITGAKLPVYRVPKEKVAESVKRMNLEGITPVLLGPAASEWLGILNEKEREALADPSGFILKASEAGVAVLGSTHAGTTFGVYEILEQNGVRWFFPGKLGTVIPKRDEFTIEPQIVTARPSVESRYFNIPAADDWNRDWNRRQRMGGYYFPSAHGVRLGKGVDVTTHPECYALFKGQRTGKQVCVSNPEVIRLASAYVKEYFRENPNAPWIGMGPNDGSGFCECESCQNLDGGDWDPFSHERSVTDRYIWFFNQVLAEISDEYPDKMIAFYVYHSYMRPPVKTKPDARIAAAIAPIGLCRIHGMHNPVCPERSYLKWLVQEWGRQIPQLYERGYWFNLADPGMLFSQVHKLRDEIPFYASHGCRGFRVESLGHWAVEGPSLYVAGKLLWNTAADPDELIADFCEQLFGPAAEPMKKYFNAIEERLSTADHHTGSCFNITHIYPSSFRIKLKEYIDAAKSLATESPYSERLEVFSAGFLNSDLLAQMIELSHKHQWSGAEKALRELEIIQQKLIAQSPPMLHPKAAPSYLKRFFQHTVDQGFKRTTNGNEVVAKLSPNWMYLIDPQNVGSALNYQRVNLTGGNWQRIDTTSTLSDVGLRYYKGLSWYRQSVSIDERHKGKRLFLWFGGVDESARVWVNGQLVGTSPVSAFTPFEVDITGEIQPGKENIVVVCTTNSRVDEIGSGGITSPVFIYAPAKGAEAELENIQPLRQTFP